MHFVRVQLLLDVLAAALVGAATLFAAGAPLAASGRLGLGALAALAALTVLVVLAVGAPLLLRSVARPVERVLLAADQLGHSGAGMPAIAPGGGPQAASLAHVAIAFERVAVALADERQRLAAKVEELERAQVALAEANESWMRSERLAVVGRLASGVAHEVGNPLGAITGYAELARVRMPADAHPDLREALTRIADAAARIDRTLRELLDFARPTPARIGAVQLEAVVETALRLARVQPRFRRVEVVLELPAGLPAVRADEHRLAQVVLNLLLNAADAMRGEGRVVMSARTDAEAVELAVADTGPGVAPEHLPRLFEPFFTTKAPGEGTGLGLATSLRIVQELGGTLRAAAGPERGAVFVVRLVRAEPPPSGTAAGPC